MNEVLTLRNVSKRFREADGNLLEVIRLRQFELGAGEQTVLVGESGSGKSTLLNLIAGILLPDEGEIVVNGTDPTRLSEAARDRFRAVNIGYVFQSFNLLQGFTALENVLLGQMFGGGSGGSDRAIQLLKSVGLEHRLHHKPRALSVGEQQRVAIARAFVTHPAVLFADEPTGNLDTATGQRITDLLFDLNRSTGSTLVLVTHARELAARCGRVLELDAGHTVN
jgi:putative ABC transport system ATP-binding protein